LELLAKWHASHIPPCPIVARKVVLVQLSALEGIPHESKILIGVLFSFYGSELSFCLRSSHFDGSTSHALLIIISNEHFHQRSSSITKRQQARNIRGKRSRVLCSLQSLRVDCGRAALPHTDQDEDVGHSQTELTSRSAIASWLFPQASCLLIHRHPG
jgi:hypothetical protein